MKYLRDIILAIESFKNDIANYPIFFSNEDLNYLDSEEAIQKILDKLSNKEYKPDFISRYRIPYDSVSTRETYLIHIEDLIIRYIIVNQFKKEFNLYSNHIEPSQFKVYSILDIYNCYNQIKKEIFIDTIKTHISHKIGAAYLDLLEKSLNFDNQYSDEAKGLIIGSKPDEYFAELFLSIIHSKLNNRVSENISRNGDEFLICANSLNELRTYVEAIIILLKEYSLEINKSKNYVKYILEERRITRVIPYEEPWPYTTPSCPPPDFPEILYKEVNYLNIFKELKGNQDIDKIDSYEKSIEYLKAISPEIEKIEAFTKNYPNHSLIGYWNSSTPIEVKKLHETINFEIVLKPYVLDKLETIIYRFPRSQYFSALAIRNVCIYAKYFDYLYNDSCNGNEKNAYLLEGFDFSSINTKISSLLFEKSNSILLNIVRSNDIFDYQKYLVIRELYFDKKRLRISKDNYKIKGHAPFSILFENAFKKLMENEWELQLPLRTIINEILN